MAVVAAKIESFLRDKQTVLSFRTLSKELDVPYCTAQSYLQTYVTNPSVSDTVKVLWHVTVEKNGVSRTELTFAPGPDSSMKHVWAVASKSLHIALPKWLEDDVAHEISLTKQPPSEMNSLRSGSYLSVISPTAEWNSRPDPRFGDAGPPKLPARNSSSLLANVRPPQKPNSTTGKTGSSREIHFKPKQNQTINLFASSRLGQRSIDRAKAAEKRLPSRHDPVRRSKDGRNDGKNRRIAEDDSDGDDGRHNIDIKKLDGGTDAMEIDNASEDDTDSSQETERQALERDRSEEENAELAREVHELLERDDEPESPVLKEVDADETMKVEILPNSDVTGKDSGNLFNRPKRSFRESFGLPEQVQGARRVRKEVEERTTQDGYLVTRRVVKTFDENGQEIRDNSDSDVGNGRSPQNQGNSHIHSIISDQNEIGKSAIPVEKMRNTKGDGNDKNTTKFSSKPKPSKTANKSGKKGIKSIRSYFHPK